MNKALTETYDSSIAALMYIIEETLIAEHNITANASLRASSSKSKARAQPYPVKVGTVAALKDIKQRLLAVVEEQMDVLRPVLAVKLGKVRDEVTRASECCICKEVVPRPMFVRPCFHSACEPCLERLAHTKKKGKLVEYSNKCPICRDELEFSGIGEGHRRVSSRRIPAAEEALHDLSTVFAKTVDIDMKWLAM